ncbi:hypothetical protein BS329_20530 [Amycolatopsis coloradensis]|uniref:Beta-ketoacyl synthase-like N-terminal domain-containing protein n=1 Tax=Amycolatopsis coloradensis TaxID=76021 RepID=A0A1R0KQU3_9PSEU|nr:beta-ketoacyl synthase N-terminal-like domain-containing protein [Amycolatopsis coloradensis]OLZ50019.1 hypothetical protein BS329_20530 [Amycolatopsis coloradensis]
MSPVISAWSAVSPFGVGRHAFADGVRERRRTAVAIDRNQWQVPDEQACLVPESVLTAARQVKGTRGMDRGTLMALTAVGDLFDEVGGTPDPATAVVFGITNASVETMMEFTRSSLVAEKPFYVDPAVTPHAVMSGAAGNCAIRYRLKGPNTTLSGGRPAALFALGYAQRLLSSGRASTVVCGGVEEYSRARSRLEQGKQAPGCPDEVLGEGCAVLLLESGGPGLAEVLAVGRRVYLDGSPGAVLDTCVRSTLEQAGVGREEVWAAVPSGASGSLGDHERAVLAERFGAEAVDRVPDGSLAGELAAGSAAFQIAALLSLAEDGSAAGRAAVITSVDRSGVLACAVLRLTGEPRQGRGF